MFALMYVRRSFPWNENKTAAITVSRMHDAVIATSNCRRTTDGSFVYCINMSLHHLKDAVVSVVIVWCVIKEHNEYKFTSKSK